MITAKQYQSVCLKLLGLRVNSSTSAADMNAASYAMCITTNPMDALKGEPAGWADMLRATVAKILSFENCAGKYLAIVSKSAGTSQEYAGCFPKCSARPTVIHASVNITSTTTAADLVQWVAANIPAS